MGSQKDNESPETKQPGDLNRQQAVTPSDFYRQAKKDNESPEADKPGDLNRP